MRRFLRNSLRGIALAGAGIGTLALTDPTFLSTVIPSQYAPRVLGTIAIINALLPGLSESLRRSLQDSSNAGLLESAKQAEKGSEK